MPRPIQILYICQAKDGQTALFSYRSNRIPVDYLLSLNSPQRQAVETIEGPIMIIAGAGSGKTRVLTYRIAYMVEHGIDPFNILALTFTNKAAREMKERISKVIGPSESKNLWMGTFHSVFARILRQEADKIGYPKNFTIYDTDDAKSLIRNILSENGLDDKIYKVNTVLNRISNAKNALITAQAYQNDPDLLQDDTYAKRPKTGEIYAQYTHRCFRAGAMDFDDLLLKTYELFSKFPEILYKYQSRFQFIMVDEFQDTNHAQYTIIRQMAALYQNICVVGDDAQSIYAFRGANIQNILNFERDYPDLNVFKLEQNYRSTQLIVNAANAIISNNKKQLKKNVWTANDQGAPLKLFKANSDNEEGGFVAQTIYELQMQHQKKNTDFAILYRTNAQSRAIEEALRRINIPYKIYGGISFYQRKEIKDMLAYIRMVINPQDDEALRRIINYPIRGIGKVTIDKLTVLAGEQNTSLWNILQYLSQFNLQVNAGVLKKLEEFTLMIRGFQERLLQTPAYDLASDLAKSSGLLHELNADKTPEGVSKYENLVELLNGIREYQDREKDDESIADMPPLAAFMQEVALLTDKDLEDPEDNDKVSLMTVHSSKGLEYHIVFIVGMEENLFPSMLSINSREELEEERRLFYVAVTRAMEQVYLSFATTRFRWGQITHGEPSRFITEIDPAFLEPIQASARPTPEAKTKLAQQYRIPAHAKLKHMQTATAASSNVDVNAFSIGQTVMHNRFGKGEILDLDGPVDGKMATIRFEAHGEKRLLLKFAKLEILG